MSDVSQSDQPVNFSAAIDLFLKGRLSDKLDKLASDDPKREVLIEEYQRDVWLEDAARRVSQIQAVTHSLKPIHPDAKGTNLYVAPANLASLDVVGSHVLGSTFERDVVGNAAALDVYKFLKVTCAGTTLLDALGKGDPAALQALSKDQEKAKELKGAFLGLVATRDNVFSSHVLAKQVYWCVADDPCDDNSYHLMSPLYPTSLMHSFYRQIDNDRFGEQNKLARQARRQKESFDGVVHDYPNLAVQKLGGTKPQNISQLNSERKGVNYLLSSLPPQWKSTQLRLPKGATSIFDKQFGARPEVRRIEAALLKFLQSDPTPNIHTRERVDAYLDRLTSEVVTMASEIQDVTSVGWSMDEAFHELSRTEKLWLDPRRSTLVGEDDFAAEWLMMDWPSAIAKRFAQWVNGRLSKAFEMTDDEAREWRSVLHNDDTWEQSLRDLRREMGAPVHLNTKKSHAELIEGKEHE